MSPGRLLRVIGGGLRGRRLRVPAGRTVRPMRSRIRESLFGILGEGIRGARVLDVFSGSGAIAIESLSRGAQEAVLLENDRRVLDLLRQNIEELGLRGQTKILAIDAYTTPLIGEDPFDLVFLDPPFPDYRDDERSPWRLATAFATGELLKPGGLIGLEYPSQLEAPPPPPGTELETQRRYGDTCIVLWRKNEPE